MKKTSLFFSILAIAAVLFSEQATAFTRGIYLTQSTAQNTKKLTYLIQKAQQFDIDTFIVDINHPSKRYADNIRKIRSNGIRYVARLVIFPHGGTHNQVTNKKIWEKRLSLAKYAAHLGANAIQLDYIRYRAQYPANPQKSKYIFKVVEYFRDQLKPYRTNLQMDIFGVAAQKPVHTIGQDPGYLATLLDAFCPMVYPSHFEPVREHATHPYETIFNSVKALRKQIARSKNNQVAIYPYIELFNYRYKLSYPQRLHYIAAEIKAARDSGANGWYVWSARNHYNPLFKVLANKK